jgi:hypothetical protein
VKISVGCAWCQLPMGTKEAEGGGSDSPLVSHSICPACQKRVTAETVLSLYKTKQLHEVL